MTVKKISQNHTSPILLVLVAGNIYYTHLVIIRKERVVFIRPVSDKKIDRQQYFFVRSEILENPDRSRIGCVRIN